MPQRHVLLGAWLLAWAFFGLPWSGLAAEPRVDDIWWGLAIAPGRRALTDVLLNVAFYVPFGILAGRAAAWPAALAAAALLSLFTEAAQLYSETRFPAIVDLVFNTAGAALGIALARLRERMRRHGTG
jgi:glycopeptide antibiotics resistance protein